MNFLQKIKKCALDNNQVLEISGSKKAKVFYSKVLENPYKIITGKKSFFEALCSNLIQKRDCDFKPFGTCGDYKATFTDGEFKVQIEKKVNAYHLIMLFKIN